MLSSANDIPPWLASLSDRTLRRLNSRLTHLLRMIDAEMQRRDSLHDRSPMPGNSDEQSR
ncbi:hypothetical protein I5L56_09790 [Pseudomonas oryzihabitans]|uniref:hypothetical protein n=1 Tax=Pseudomonas oryzihabitans TaxID=47885 RepID=UPI0018D7A709|nr:hypothetical protein [Pseudomonas oryzihabitans]MBH3329914.1 hypothetical protein [Pseudomonas oryzihabitans]